LAKADLVTGLVGEFPELQGVVGGLLLAAEGCDPAVARAVAEHYRPLGPADAIPATAAGCLVALADKLDTIQGLLEAGELPSGSRDPFGLRRAANGVLRILAERGWVLGAEELEGEFWTERLHGFLVDKGFSTLEVRSVLAQEGSLPALLARLEALRGVRSRPDFRTLLELTRRIHNIVPQVEQLEAHWRAQGWRPEERAAVHAEPAAQALGAAIDQARERVEAAADGGGYDEVVLQLCRLAEPVRRFFDDVLVIDEQDRDGTHRRKELVARLASLTTRYFDIRELAGQAVSKR
ncbi:MAG TPA: glycine--tRNA ligase subunit beta, partial [Candidatus Polarisedimenticolaceae bacterium]|nr:glycine--tRNA ligase subunit beta [Candidatus Polarisedimenticolaceae bacterium]